MQGGKEYKIQFAGLSIGQHAFEFEVKDSFFKNLDYSEIKKGNIIIHLELTKQSAMMILQFTVTGTVEVECDRCTVPFDLPINGNYRLIVKTNGQDVGEEDDDIISVSANESELYLQQFIYEYIMLSVPLKRIHPENKKGESTCDKEMIKKLKQFEVEGEGISTTDPRWEGLKNIKLN